MTYIVGLTGGIASGKTTASQHFATLSVPIIDTDILARECVAKGQPALDLIAERFGAEILWSGELNRIKLRKIITQSAEDKLWLEAVLHPLIHDKVKHAITQCTEPYCIVVVPLLYENWHKYQSICDAVINIEADPAIQVQRICARDKDTPSQAQSFVAQQASNSQRREIATKTIINNGNQQTFLKAIEKAHQEINDLMKKK